MTSSFNLPVGLLISYELSTNDLCSIFAVQKLFTASIRAGINQMLSYELFGK